MLTISKSDINIFKVFDDANVIILSQAVFLHLPITVDVLIPE